MAEQAPGSVGSADIEQLQLPQGATTARGAGPSLGQPSCILQSLLYGPTPHFNSFSGILNLLRATACHIHSQQRVVIF
eukprot:498206-Pelagomonas_calceolata.AAC.1